MSNVTIVKGSLFDAPKGSIICHACNCQGVWGSGIAKQFAQRYPHAYKFYQRMCREGGDLLGLCLLLDTGNHIVGCLFTSANFGSKVDSVPEILDATADAIGDLIWQNTSNKPIHMCKINSGLFGVDWKLTQEVLESYPEQEFTVWEI